MADNYEQQIDNIGKKLFGLIEQDSNAIIKKKMKLLQKRLEALQDTFFTIFISKVIGAMSAPELGAYTPSWTPLSKKTTLAKKRQGMHGSEFYMMNSFTNKAGSLLRSLTAMKATTRFGTPIVLLSDLGGTYRNQTIYDNAGAGLTSTGKSFNLSKIKNQNLKRTISVDMFPKVEALSGNVEEYLPLKTAQKLRNYKGRRNRPILGPYMEWWLNVKAREIVERTL